MHAMAFLRQALSREFKPVYAVFGDDAYLRRESLATIRKTVLGPDADGTAVARFAGEQAKLADVFDELRTLPFLSPLRVAIVDDADPFVTAHRQELEHYVERPVRTSVLVLNVKTWTSTTKLAKLVEKNGQSIDCRAPKERELPGWLVELAETQFEVRLEKPAAQLLLELVGPEIALLASDLEKLATYVGDKKRIREADVAKLVGAGRVETIWNMLEAATSGETSSALALLDGLVASGEAPVGLLAAMSSSLRRLYHAGSVRLAGRPIEDACQEAGISTNSFVMQRVLAQHRSLGRHRVDRLPEVLLGADLDIKGRSSLPPKAILERLVVWLARKRQEIEA